MEGYKTYKNVDLFRNSLQKPTEIPSSRCVLPSAPNRNFPDPSSPLSTPFAASHREAQNEIVSRLGT